MFAIAPLSRPCNESTLRFVAEQDRNVYWLFMHSKNATEIRRTCFSSQMLDDILYYQTLVRKYVAQRQDTPAFIIIASDSNVYNLGGDLDLFIQLIRSQDHASLLDFARRCVQCVYGFNSCLDSDVHSIALVQGNALGGGFEVALSCKTIVAEEGASLGFPEIIFDLFPGMGAYSFMRQRISSHLAERIMIDGKTYTAEEMHKIGLVDYLVPKGKGKHMVEKLISNHQRINNGWKAIQQARRITDPVTYEELMRITEIWAKSAVQLGKKSLRTMERLVYAQNKKVSKSHQVVESCVNE